ncbi:hypothetical protein PMAYCL1PPCAC_03441, partial [Pristionchus mayeri]
VHCNKCQAAPSSESRSFWFTNCMHIYCKKCVQKQSIPSTKFITCGHCKKQCQVLEIGANMPPKVKKLFTPVEQIVKKQKEIMSRVCKFQEDQLASLISFSKKEKENFAKVVKAYQQLNGKVGQMTKEKAALEESVTFHRKRLEEFEGKIKELQLQGSRMGGRRDSSNFVPAISNGLSFLNGTSQSDPSEYSGFHNSMMSDGNASFTAFLNGNPSTPMCSQVSNGILTTPKILGLQKKGGGGGGVRSDNPYLAMWNQASVDRQKRTGGGGGAARSRSSEVVDVTSTGSPMNWTGRK